MTTSNALPTSKPLTPDYGIDAPSVLRNLFLFGVLCFILALVLPPRLHLGPVVLLSRSFFWPAAFLIVEGLLFLLYVKVGKLRHRGRMLSHSLAR